MNIFIYSMAYSDHLKIMDSQNPNNHINNNRQKISKRLLSDGYCFYNSIA